MKTGVLVVGAGPTGLYFSSRVASKGWEVKVYEARRGVGEKVCGGLVSEEAVREVKVLGEVVVNRIDGAVFRKGEEEVIVERRRVARVIDRELLEGVLLDQAVAEGVAVEFGKKVEVDGGFKVGGERVEAKVYVGADGALSEVRRRVFGIEGEYVLGVQGIGKGEFHEDLVEVYLDEGKGFFGWVIPLDGGTARVGVGVRVGEKDPGAYLKRLARRRKVRVERFGARTMVLSPPGPLVKGNVALVGDAGLQVKASTGGGLYYGLTGARVLGEVVDRVMRGEGRLREYEGAYAPWKRRLRLHYGLRKLFLEKKEELWGILKEEWVKEVLEREGSMENPFSLLPLLTRPRILRLALPLLPLLF